jgi:hypothetical protein
MTTSSEVITGAGQEPGRVIDLLFWGIVKRTFDLARVQRLSRVVTGLTVLAGMLGFLVAVIVCVAFASPRSLLPLLAVAGGALLLAPLPLRALTALPLTVPSRPAPRDGLVPATPAARPLLDGYVLLLAGLALTLVLVHYLIDFAFLTGFKEGAIGLEVAAIFSGVFVICYYVPYLT